MTSLKLIIRTIISVSALLLFSPGANAQKYTVDSFRMLVNDVTAFINPVSDLNDDGCALIKVQASPEFAFSTPLGIVKREDKTGEIWLYIPKGSKKITLKHPEWGVLRDYKFPLKIESHVTYELKVAEPPSRQIASEAIPVVTTVHDTLVVTRTDTLLINFPKIKTPLSMTVTATIGFGGTSNTLAGGIMLSLMRRHGAFLHLSSDFSRIGHTVAVCDKTGALNGNTPYYSGNKRHGFFTATAGASHRLSKTFGIFEGIGYGYDNTAWQLAESEGGGYVKNSYYSHNGVTFEAGVHFSLKRVSLSASVISIKGSQWYGTIGIGIIIGMQKNHEK